MRAALAAHKRRRGRAEWGNLFQPVITIAAMFHQMAHTAAQVLPADIAVKPAQAELVGTAEAQVRGIGIKTAGMLPVAEAVLLTQIRSIATK